MYSYKQLTQDVKPGPAQNCLDGKPGMFNLASAPHKSSSMESNVLSVPCAPPAKRAGLNPCGQPVETLARNAPRKRVNIDGGRLNGKRPAVFTLSAAPPKRCTPTVETAPPKTTAMVRSTLPPERCTPQKQSKANTESAGGDEAGRRDPATSVKSLFKLIPLPKKMIEVTPRPSEVVSGHIRPVNDIPCPDHLLPRLRAGYYMAIDTETAGWEYNITRQAFESSYGHVAFCQEEKMTKARLVQIGWIVAHASSDGYDIEYAKECNGFADFTQTR